MFLGVVFRWRAVVPVIKVVRVLDPAPTQMGPDRRAYLNTQPEMYISHICLIYPFSENFARGLTPAVGWEHP